MKILMLGGHSDGKCIEVDNLREMVTVCWREHVSRDYAINHFDFTVNAECYYLCQFMFNGIVENVYVCKEQKENGSSVIKMLMEGYRRPHEKNRF